MYYNSLHLYLSLIQLKIGSIDLYQSYLKFILKYTFFKSFGDRINDYKI